MNVESKQILKKDSLISKIKKTKESSRNNKKKNNKKIWRAMKRQKSDTGDENKIDGLVKKWLPFLEKNLSKIENLDQKTCKKKTAREKPSPDLFCTVSTKVV